MSNTSTIIVCQGPPRCPFQGDDAVAAQMAGCLWCQRIVIDEDGGERVEQPGTA